LAIVASTTSSNLAQTHLHSTPASPIAPPIASLKPSILILSTIASVTCAIASGAKAIAYGVNPIAADFTAIDVDANAAADVNVVVASITHSCIGGVVFSL